MTQAFDLNVTKKPLTFKPDMFITDFRNCGTINTLQ